jgi:two-component system sensor histidine kinase HydH
LTEPLTGHAYGRAAVVVLLVLAVTAAHWWTPRDQEFLHALHVALRKLCVLLVVMAAVWFDLRAALITAAGVTLLYAPHVAWQWGGEHSENINQLGELVRNCIITT